MTAPARDQLVRLVRLMVDRPEQVAADEVDEDDSTVIELQVADEDLGKVIGRQGRTARALRSVLSARKSQGQGDFRLEIIDD